LQQHEVGKNATSPYGRSICSSMKSAKMQLERKKEEVGEEERGRNSRQIGGAVWEKDLQQHEVRKTATREEERSRL